jgi:UDP-N-acetylmuramoyl-tripeptide--D-alanyl-D-alanine ligase
MELVTAPNGLTVINDAYNANPDSMRAALLTSGELLAQRLVNEPASRLVAVLGDMLEMGDEAPSYHQAIGQLAVDQGVSVIVGVGQYAPELVAAAQEQGIVALIANDRDAVMSIMPELQGTDIVLVKASRGVGLEEIAQQFVTSKDTEC